MTLKEKINEHWEVFRTIEDDLKVVSKYVKFDQRNYATYSVELSKLLIFICSEVESVFKIYSHEVHGEAINNIGQFRTSLIQDQNNTSKLEAFDVRVRKGIGVITPWRDFSSNSPSWWVAYNKLKHEYIDNLTEGNLEVVLSASAGLYSLLTTLMLVKNIDCNNDSVSVYPIPTLFKSNHVDAGGDEVVYSFDGSVLTIDTLN